jgi:hypothetical protein
LRIKREALNTLIGKLKHSKPTEIEGYKTITLRGILKRSVCEGVTGIQVAQIQCSVWQF